MAKSKPKSDARGRLVEFFDIDKHALDKEWEEQASNYFEIAADLEEANAETDQAKARIDVVYADLDGEIRENPEAFGFEGKPTEPSIKACILGQDRYKKVIERFNEKRRAAGLLGAAVRAMEHKKRAIEKLTDLFIAGYFSDPKVKGEAREAVKDARASRVLGRKKNRG